jgi:hypothetical protein
MHCGCSLPGETIGQKLNKLVAKNQKQQLSHLIPPNNPNLLAGTHPSDHNAIFNFSHRNEGEKERARRMAKITSRQKRDTQKKGNQKSIQSNTDHDPAFLVPVPMYFGGVGACAAYHGGVMQSGLGVCVGSSACAAVGYHPNVHILLISHVISQGAGGCTAGGSVCGIGGGCGSAGCGGGGCGGGGCGGGGCGGGGCGGGGS